MRSPPTRSTDGRLRGCRGLHVGPCDTLEQTEQTHTALDTWLREQGRVPSGPMGEIYLSDPEAEPDPSTWRTEIYCPVSWARRATGKRR